MLQLKVEEVIQIQNPDLFLTTAVVTKVVHVTLLLILVVEANSSLIINLHSKFQKNDISRVGGLCSNKIKKLFLLVHQQMRMFTKTMGQIVRLNHLLTIENIKNNCKLQ